MEFVWIFNGGGAFPSGVFSTRDNAEQWIAANHLSGTLTRYPLDQGAYQWAVAAGHFKPKNPRHDTPEFIGRFASGAEHYHYENGTRPT
jgi:hypothetical protein